MQLLRLFLAALVFLALLIFIVIDWNFCRAVLGFAGTIVALVVLVAVAARGLARQRVAARRAAQYAAREARSSSALAGLAADGVALLHGTVRYAKGETEAMRTEMEQVGSELRSGGKVASHTWTEVSRQTLARAFVLERGSGERVIVEASPATALFHELTTGAEWQPADGGPRRRKRLAVLGAGEEVWVEGSLAARPDEGQLDDLAPVVESAGEGATAAPPYRAGGRGTRWHFVRDASLVVSTASLAANQRDLARDHRRLVISCLLALLLPLYLAVTYIDRAAFGHTADGVVVDAEVWTRQGGRGADERDALVTAEGRTWSFVVDETPIHGSRFPVRVGHWSVNAGEHADWTTWGALLALASAVVALGLGAGARRNPFPKAPWYRREGLLLVESGPGPLVGPP